MRITTGSKKGHTIKVPTTDVRPTKDMVRQAIFSIIGHQIKDLAVADLFAGSGSLGLEALSRGALHCDFVEENSKVMSILEENLTLLDLWEKANTFEMSVVDFSHMTPPESYHLIFADPPYDYEIHKKVIISIAKLLKPGGVLILEHKKNQPLAENPNELALIDQRKYGITSVTFFQKV